MKIGAQLYTVREYMKDEKGMAESLKKIADIGYRYVQVSGTGPYDPKWMKEELDKNGLQCVITHTSQERMIADPETVALEHEILGTDYIGIGMYDIRRVGMNGFIERFKPVAECFKKHGKLLMYHNHDLEFEKINGELIMDQLLQAFSPDELGFTLDTFWVQAGGADPAWWLTKLSGRTPCIHFKDMGFRSNPEERFSVGRGRIMLPVGEGNMNNDAIISAALENGTKYALVEQDDCNGEDPFECLRRSYDYLVSKGLEA